MSELACCGCACDGCKEYKISCGGCNAVKGKPQWVTYLPTKQCPFYICCVEEKQLKHCGQCEKLPCSLFYELNDPSLSKEQIDYWLNERLKNLKNAL